jgi:hypothetical protein
MEHGMNVEESEVIENLRNMKDENDIKMMGKHPPEPNVLVPHQNQVVEEEKVSF